MNTREIPDFVKLKFGRYEKLYSVFKHPIPHLITPTKTVIHGWSGDAEKNGRRACTAERFLLNPYRGCTHRCQYPCYTRAFSSFNQFYRLFWEENIPSVVINFPEILAKELDDPDLKYAAWGYLSATTDPFQKPLEPHFELTYKIMKVLMERNLGFEFITKSIPREKVITLLKGYKYVFAQFTITSDDEEFRKIFEPNTESYEKRFKAMKTFNKNGIPVILRYDPVEPFFNDDEAMMERVFSRAYEYGANHVIFSISDKNSRYWDVFERNLRNHDKGSLIKEIKAIYTDKQAGELHANLDYRLSVIKKAKKIATDIGMTFALCMEFEKDRETKRYIDLNQEFKTSNNCEGIDTPLFRKDSKGGWKPIENCDGNCLYGDCNVSCGISELKACRSINLRDWKNFSEKFFRKIDMEK